MLKAAALYMVIVVSILVAVISVSLLTIGFYYRLGFQKKLRLEKLQSNISSGTVLLLSKDYVVSDSTRTVDLYGEQKDSLQLSKKRWGVFQLNTAKAFEQTDTLRISFLTGCSFEDQSVLYLADEDRPLSLSGSTQLTGNAEIPKSGLKQAYVDGKGYEGKELLKGKSKDSNRELPAVDQALTDSLIAMFGREGKELPALDSVGNSFFNQVQVYHLKGGKEKLEKTIQGHIILICDTILSIGAGAKLKDVQVYAQAILLEDGFKGSCQLFARDSIIAGKRCELNYPSFAGVFKAEKASIQPKIRLGEDSRFSGMLFSYEKGRTELQTLISLGKDCLIKGQIYAAGYIKLDKPVTVQGKLYARRFIMQTPATLYENYLIDIILNRKSLSPYYLSTLLLKENQTDQQILKWLN